MKFFCKKCKHKQRVVYLENLKSGGFEVGRTKNEVVYHPLEEFFYLIREPITPLIIKTRCERCNSEIHSIPISVEYVLFLTEEQKELKNFYV